MNELYRYSAPASAHVPKIAGSPTTLDAWINLAEGIKALCADLRNAFTIAEITGESENEISAVVIVADGTDRRKSAWMRVRKIGKNVLLCTKVNTLEERQAIATEYTANAAAFFSDFALDIAKAAQAEREYLRSIRPTPSNKQMSLF